MMVAIGIAIVALREESAKAASRVQRLHRVAGTMEQRLWTLEMELARLRGPDEIRRRAAAMGLSVVRPSAR